MARSNSFISTTPAAAQPKQHIFIPYTSKSLLVGRKVKKKKKTPTLPSCQREKQLHEMHCLSSTMKATGVASFLHRSTTLRLWCRTPSTILSSRLAPGIHLERNYISHHLFIFTPDRFTPGSVTMQPKFVCRFSRTPRGVLPARCRFLLPGVVGRCTGVPTNATMCNVFSKRLCYFYGARGPGGGFDAVAGAQIRIVLQFNTCAEQHVAQTCRSSEQSKIISKCIFMTLLMWETCSLGRRQSNFRIWLYLVAG